MSRLSIRPRPVDYNKKLPIVKSFKDLDDDDTPTSTSTRNSQYLRLTAEADTEVQHVLSKKLADDIPTPEFVIVDTYERDYSRTFGQPTSYIRARGVRSELSEFVEYDLDMEDEEWLQESNNDRTIISPEKFEYLLFKLEVLDHKARERAALLNLTLGTPIPVLLQLDAAIESLQAHAIKHTVIESVFEYWKDKRERWQKPILRRLQPPVPANDTNPYNVFRPREKAHRLHTRRMQRRENNVQSFEKLRQVRRNLDQAKTILEALIKREEKKRDVMETEVCLQRIQLLYRHETDLLEDSFVLPSFQAFSKFGSSEDELMESEDVANNQLPVQPARIQTQFVDSKPVLLSSGGLRQDLRWRNAASWIRRVDPAEPVMPFTKPLLTDKLAAAGIVPPSDGSKTPVSPRSNPFRGRVGRGGRIIFDRWNLLMHMPVNCGDSMYISPGQPSSRFM